MKAGLRVKAFVLQSVFLFGVAVAGAVDFTYTTNHPDNTLTITGYTGAGGAVNIPSTIDGKSVTAIGFRSFEHDNSIESVTFPNSVVSIGNKAFQYCRSITNITFGTGLETIGDDSFLNCDAIEGVVIPDSVVSIGARAFYGCKGLAVLTIGSGVETIGSAAFASCSGLKNVVIPDNVTSLGNSAFSWCTGITNMIISGSLTSIESSAFGACHALENIVIPNSVQSIGMSAFELCLALTNVTFGSSVQAIGEKAFYRCESLVDISIPDSVTEIDDYAFARCQNLLSITVGAGNPAYSSLDGVLFNKDRTTLIQYPGAKPGGYTVPDTVSFIGLAAFYYCEGITALNIPDSVVLTNIARYAFAQCTALASVTLGNNVPNIPNDAFAWCTSLSTIAIGESVEMIGVGAFYRCIALANVVLPDSLTTIGESAFEYCTALTNVVAGNGVDLIHRRAFKDCDLLEGAYFAGDAPFHQDQVFVNSTNVTVYYLDRASGWEAEYAGRPTALWLAEYAAEPVFDPDGGAHAGSNVDVTVTCATDGAVIRYTVNGENPTIFSPVVASGGTVSVPLPGTLKARAWRDGKLSSYVKSADYLKTESSLDAVPVYRFYSAGAPESTYTHLWTINETERDVLMTFPSWQYEGIGWYALTNMESGSVPLYRLYEPNIRRHLYTINATEYVALDSGSWNGEDVQYFVYPTNSASGSIPAYRFYHSANQNHHFTIDENEKDTIIATPEWGYTYEGIAFYVFQTNAPSSFRGSIAKPVEDIYPAQAGHGVGQPANGCGGCPNGYGAANAFYNAACGRWYLLVETDMIELAPVPGDYNGDGVTDIALYEQDTGFWFLMPNEPESGMASFKFQITPLAQWGGPGFEPFAFDYDSDGIDDLAVYHEVSGTWYVVSVDGRILLWGIELDEED